MKQRYSGTQMPTARQTENMWHTPENLFVNHWLRLFAFV